jgi:drug/metabolite transporter (DMT)-like permease
MGVLLALASAVSYGLSDFAGGLLARRLPFATVAFLGQAGALLLMVILALFDSAAVATPADLAWGALSGIGTGVGMLFLFRGLGRGAMAVVVPSSAVSGVALPILIGVLLLGERPSVPSWLGIAVAIPTLWLVSTTTNGPRAVLSPAAADGLVAGIGIAVQYIALAQSGPQSGLWPVTAGRVTALLTVLPLVLATHAPIRIRPSRLAGCVATGAAAALALGCFLFAARQQLLAVAVVLSSLYPVVPVILGLTALHERLTRRQVVGLFGAAAAIALLTVF